MRLGWILDRLLAAVLPGGPRSASIRAELRQDAAARRSAHGRMAAAAWYTRQAVSVTAWALFDRLRGRSWRGASPATGRLGLGGPGADLADARRLFHKSPGYALAVVATLGLSLATTITVFAVVNGILIRDLPYPDPARLVRFDRIYQGEVLDGGVSYPDLLDWRERIESVRGIAGHTGHELTYLTEGVAEVWNGRATTTNLLDVLGVRPALGPGFSPERHPPGSRVVVLSHELWRARLGGDPGIIGKSLELSGERYEVVGVLPAGFAYPTPTLDYLVPLPESRFLEQRGAGFLDTVARLAPDASLEAATEEVAAVVAAIDSAHGDWDEGVELRRCSEVQVAPLRRILWVLMGAVSLLLVVACANIAGLTLARTEARAAELAVRSAIGAGSGRLVRQLLAESLALSLVGGALGTLAAAAAVRGFQLLAPAELPRRAEVYLDPTVVLFAAIVAMAAGVLFGLGPALHGARRGPGRAIRRAASDGSDGRRAQEALAILQVALTVALLSGAGLLVRSFQSLTAVDPGFDSRNVLVAQLGLEGDAYREAQGVLDFHAALLDRVAAADGVESVGLSTHLPFSPSVAQLSVVRDGEVYRRGQTPLVGMEVIDGEYLDTLELTLRRGRLPERGAAAPPRQVVINESAARLLWGDADPIGRRFSFDVEQGRVSEPDTFWTVAGVVGDVRRQSLDEPASPLAYYPMPDFRRQYSFMSGRSFYLVVRSDRQMSELVGSVRAAVADLDPRQPLRAVDTLEQMVRATTIAARARTAALALFAFLAAVLALVGVYGVMAYAVARRRREIGVRMALGASGGAVRRGVLARGAVVAGIGAALGISAAMMLGPLLSNVLFGVAPRDPATLAAVVTLALAGCLAAAYLPARRASTIDPVRVLRDG